MIYQTLPLIEGVRVEAMMDTCKRGTQATLPRPQITEIPYELGECIVWDTLLVKNLVLEGFVRESRGWGYFSYLGGLDPPARHLLSQYRHRVSPVVLLVNQ